MIYKSAREDPDLGEGGGVKVLEVRGEDAMVMEGRGEGVKGLWRGSDRVWVWAGLGLTVALPFLERFVS